MTNLDKLKLWEKQIRVTPSKHTVVQMPKEGQPVCSFVPHYLFSPVVHRGCNLQTQ